MIDKIKKYLSDRKDKRRIEKEKFLLFSQSVQQGTLWPSNARLFKSICIAASFPRDTAGKENKAY
jgi:hypothetical protein